MAKREAASNQLSEPDASLLAAAREGDIKGLRRALDAGANPNAKDEHGPAILQAYNEMFHSAETVVTLAAAGAALQPLRDALPWAIRTGNRGLADKLMAAGADLDAVAMYGTALVLAAKLGELQLAETLIAAGANVNLRAPLAIAIKHGHSAIACALVKAGANVTIGRQVSDVSPIAQSTAMGDLHMLRALIEAGAQLDQPGQALITDDRGNPTFLTGLPLPLAARYGRLESARVLIDSGADVHRKDSEGLTPLDWAMRSGQAAVAELLRAAGGDQRRDTPEEQLLAAAQSGDVDAVRRLVGQGAPVDARDRRETTQGQTPLMLASAAGRLEAVEALLSAGADVHATDDPGGKPAGGLSFILREAGIDELIAAKFKLNRTALMWAADGGHAPVISAILAAGAKANSKDYTNCTALHLAARRGDPESVRLLLAAGVKVDLRGPNRQTPLSLAAESGSLEAVRVLLDSGADITPLDSDRRGALDIAAAQGRADMVRLMLAVLPDEPARSEVLGRALAFAVWVQGAGTEDSILSVAEQLIAAGARVGNHAVYAMTPLDTAAFEGYERVAAMLLAAGAEVNAIGWSGDSALQCAVLKHRLGVARLLLDHGADPNHCDRDGKSVLQRAREGAESRGDDSMLLLLQQYAAPTAKGKTPKASDGGSQGHKKKP